MELSGVNRSLRQSMHARTQMMWVEEDPYSVIQVPTMFQRAYT